jgi:hypothetical protein
MIEVSAVRMEQGDLVLYSGVIRAGDLLKVYDVYRWSTEELEDGYQRELWNDRARRIADYLRKCTVPIIPPILASIRQKVDFKPLDGHGGILRLPTEKGTVWVIDGQTRVGAFDKLRERLEKIREGELGTNEEREELKRLLDFPISILFLDGPTSLERVKAKVKSEVRDQINVKHIEKAFFLIVNATAKRLKGSLLDRDAYGLVRAGFEGIPPIDDRGLWRVEATELTHRLTSKKMPLFNMVNIVGARGMGRPIQLSSFVDSLEPLLANETFTKLSKDDQLEFLRLFWQGLKDRVPKAFSEDKKERRKFFLLKTIGVRALNRVANDVFNYWCEGKVSKKLLDGVLDSLAEVPWDRDSSPLAAFGGEKGVKEAHKVLLQALAKAGHSVAKKALMNHGWPIKPVIA